MLRVKVKSLAEEARIIRREEHKIPWGMLRRELRDHRVVEVRSESRSAGLAYGFIKGRSLSEMEKYAVTSPDWIRIKKLVEKYGPLNQVAQAELMLKIEGHRTGYQVFRPHRLAA
jgi:hypothetical protein